MEGLAEFDELGIQLYGARAAKAAAEAEAAAAAAAAAEAAKRQQRAAEASSAARQQQQQQRSSAAPKRKAGAAASASTPSSSASAAAPPGVSGGLPIIVVPAAATARLNMINAPAFFASGVFEHPDALRAAGAKKSADGRDREGGGQRDRGRVELLCAGGGSEAQEPAELLEVEVGAAPEEELPTLLFCSAKVFHHRQDRRLPLPRLVPRRRRGRLRAQPGSSRAGPSRV